MERTRLEMFCFHRESQRAGVAAKFFVPHGSESVAICNARPKKWFRITSSQIVSWVSGFIVECIGLTGKAHTSDIFGLHWNTDRTRRGVFGL